jgi:NAD-dependent dihydropyrimidine dehydrogenase PreA subunit
MTESKVSTGFDLPAANPILIDPDLCEACYKCVAVCEVDILIPNPEKDKPPIVIYPGECWYEGNCVSECPNPGALKLNQPLMQRVRWKRKETGEHFRT